MGRKSEMQTLVDLVEASAQARERAKAILLTLARTWSVQAGCRRLGELECELRRPQAEFDIARSEAATTVTARLATKGGRR